MEYDRLVECFEKFIISSCKILFDQKPETKFSSGFWSGSEIILIWKGSAQNIRSNFGPPHENREVFFNFYFRALKVPEMDSTRPLDIPRYQIFCYTPSGCNFISIQSIENLQKS